MKLIYALALALTMAALSGCGQSSSSSPTSSKPKVGKGHNWDRVCDPTNGSTVTETYVGGQ
jgi:hypothetical protein